MKKYIPLIVLVLLIALVIYWFTFGRKREKGGMTAGYKFFSGSDSPGGDIKQISSLSGNIAMLKKACKETPGCIAFNTAGWLKKSVVNPTEFKTYSGYPDWMGLYVKTTSLKNP